MQGALLRKYGDSCTITFRLFEPDGVAFKTDAVYAASDVKMSKDEGAEANTTNGFVDEGTGYSIALTAAEMQAARVVLYVVDQTNPKVWLDTAMVIETYGHASAQHAFDLGSGTQTVDLSGSATSGVVDGVLDAAVSGHQTAGSVGEEIHLAKSMLANKRVHTISTGVDQVMDNDGTTVLRTMTPVDQGNDTIRVDPS